MSEKLTVIDLFLHRNELGLTFRDLLAERIRAQGIAWNADHPEMFEWRGKPWMDGIRVDLDEPEQVEYLVKGVTAVIREVVGEEFWAELAAAYLARELTDTTHPAPTHHRATGETLAEETKIVPIERDLWWGHLCPALANIGALKEAQRDLLALGVDGGAAGRILSRVQKFYVVAAYRAAQRYLSNEAAHSATHTPTSPATKET